MLEGMVTVVGVDDEDGVKDEGGGRGCCSTGLDASGCEVVLMVGVGVWVALLLFVSSVVVDTRVVVVEEGVLRATVKRRTKSGLLPLVSNPRAASSWRSSATLSLLGSTLMVLPVCVKKR